MVNWGYHKVIYKFKDFLEKYSDIMIGIEIQLKNEVKAISDKTEDFHLTYVC